MQDYRNLVDWQKAHQLVLDVYTVTDSFPKSEIYGLTPQLRRASSSIPTNLAEGSGKLTDPDFKKYVGIAFGSSNEVEYLLLLSHDLNFLIQNDYTKLDGQIKEIKKMLSGLSSKLSN